MENKWAPENKQISPKIIGNYLVCERLRRISLISEDSSFALIMVTVDATEKSWIDIYMLSFKSIPKFLAMNSEIVYNELILNMRFSC